MFVDDDVQSEVIAFENEHFKSSQRAGAELLEPYIAAVELQAKYRRKAMVLAPGDESTQDDLVQEMAHAALHCTRPHSRSFYLWLASWRAKNYLRWWLTPIEMRESDEFIYSYQLAMKNRREEDKQRERVRSTQPLRG